MSIYQWSNDHSPENVHLQRTLVILIFLSTVTQMNTSVYQTAKKKLVVAKDTIITYRIQDIGRPKANHNEFLGVTSPEQIQTDEDWTKVLIETETQSNSF